MSGRFASESGRSKTEQRPLSSVNCNNAEKGKNAVSIEQFPLRAAYAITIHKSQGQTFDYINIKAPHCWEPGQLYVALSRARSVNGIYLMDKITEDSLITDTRVKEYYNSLKNEYVA